MKKSIFTLFNLLLITSIVAVGCDVIQSDSTNGPSDVKVQMQVQTANSAAVSAALTTGQQQMNGIEIQEVKLFIDEMELESVQDDSTDFEIEDFVVNLPLDGSPLVLTEKEVQQGIYDEFELEIDRPDSEDFVNDVDIRDDNGSYSVVVKGLYNGEEFTYRSTEDFEIEMDLNPPLEISGSDNSVLTIDIDLNRWFRGSNGEVLDPTDSSNFDRIDENIEDSFESYEEEDDDDDDDDDDDSDD